MVNEWPIKSLGKLTELIIDCPHSTPEWTSEGEIVLRNQNIRNGRLDLSSPSFTNNEGYLSRIKRGTPRADDLVLTREAPMGEVCILPPGLKCCLGQRMVLIRTDKQQLWPRYLLYQLQSPFLRHQIGWNEGTGTTVSNIRIPNIKAFNILRPLLPEQKAIAHILGSLDDKIELNRRMNATLEGMAQALFKSWFVDFDPVLDNALVAGNPIPDELEERAETRRQALANGTANREAAKPFPASFYFTEELGWIPEGWEVKSLDSILRSVSDTYPLKNVSSVIFLNTGDILDGKFLHNNHSETKGLPGQAKKSIRKHDILYSEIRPKNKRFAYVYFDSPNHIVSTKLMVLRAKHFISSSFAYLILKRDSTINYLQMMAESRSGTFPQITFDILSEIEFALPTELSIVTTFTEKFLDPLFQKQIKNDLMSEGLSNLRDTLLPKLISGELRISEAAKLTEEALT